MLTNSKLKYNEGQEMVDVCKAIDDMIVDSRKEGEYKIIVQAATNMKRQKKDDNEIATILGISEETLAEAFEYISKTK